MLKKIVFPVTRIISRNRHVSTVDKKEMVHFTKLADTWWEERGPMKYLHQFNKCRVSAIQDRLMQTASIPEDVKDSSQPLKTLSILDVGCGAGILAESLAKLGSRTVGLDANFELIEQAKVHAQNNNFPNLEYVCSSIEEFSANNENSYDVVVASEIIEHVTQKNEFLNGCVKCLKSGGSIIMTTNSKTLLARFFDIYLAENVFGAMPKGAHQYEKFISVKDLKGMLKRENCETIFDCGIVYNPFKKEWFLSSCNYFWYILHAVKRS